MKNQELNTVLQKLRENNIEENAYLGFFTDGGGLHESCIKANKDGLRLYAAALIEASLEIDNRNFNIEEEEEFFSIKTDWVSESSDIFFSYVELSNLPKAEIEPIKEHKENWKDKLMGYVLGGIIIFILISILVGVITIISWLF